MKIDPLSKAILDAIKRDGRSLYRLALDAEQPYGTVARFANRERPNIRVQTAAALMDALGLEVRPVKPTRRKGGA